ncbi:unnamed protein product [Paramecium sonneborni]|uniref:Uncharacterized protein n=1 Tax=Paramecium sonneborni TaxID=65129 RepID=A0A8S1MJU6_9CILI|nr:unnamed protein product [Paramecium sonneborni]
MPQIQNFRLQINLSKILFPLRLIDQSYQDQDNLYRPYVRCPILNICFINLAVIESLDFSKLFQNRETFKSFIPLYIQELCSLFRLFVYFKSQFNQNISFILKKGFLKSKLKSNNNSLQYQNKIQTKERYLYTFLLISQKCQKFLFLFKNNDLNLHPEFFLLNPKEQILIFNNQILNYPLKKETLQLYKIYYKNSDDAFFQEQ